MILWPNVRAWSPDSLVAGGARARFAIDRRDLLDLLLVSSRLAQSRPVAAPARTLGGIPARRDAATPAVRVISEDRPSNVCANDSTACWWQTESMERQRWRWERGRRNGSRSVHSLLASSRQGVCASDYFIFPAREFGFYTGWNAIEGYRLKKR